LNLPTGSVEKSKVLQGKNTSFKTASSAVAKQPLKDVQIDRAASEMKPWRIAANLHPPMFALGRSGFNKVKKKYIGIHTLQPPQKKTRWAIARLTITEKNIKR
jgi:hypothetical protein